MSDKLPFRSKAQETDRKVMLDRDCYDFSDYGFLVSRKIDKIFHVVATKADDKEGFLFFFLKKDIDKNIFSLFNLHCYMKSNLRLENFARGLGESMKKVKLEENLILGTNGLTYERITSMKDMFKGNEQIINFIGGNPELIMRDSHSYFHKFDNNYYTGMLHDRRQPFDKYDKYRALLFTYISFVNGEKNE